MYELDATTIIVNFAITWSVGLFPSVLIRYGLLKRPLAKWSAIGTCALIWMINIVLFIAIGGAGNPPRVLVLIVVVSYWILRQGTVAKIEQEKKVVSEQRS